MKFGDAITVTTGTNSRLAVYLWRYDGCEPSIIFEERVVRLDLDAIVTPWRCARCRNTRVSWAVRIRPRCGTCHPLSTKEQEFITTYATGAVRHLADKLDDPAGKAAMYQLLDEAISSGDMLALARLSLETLACSHILKHGRGDLL
ncbi:MAG: hypothetical protein NW202_13035 [Nitrospira sp.]|nr:hypothetical protein [Nitrospira sp.]